MLRRLLPPLGIIALGLLFFADLVLHPAQVLYSDYSDTLAQHIPNKRFLVESWHQTGELPLWCPYRFGGEPFVTDIQVAIFYPPHWPLLLMPAPWVGVALSWLVVAHVILAGLCMYAYARDQRLGTAGSLVAACGFMFAGRWLLHLLGGGHYIVIGLAWVPLALLLLDRAIRQGSWLCATGAGIAYGLVVLGTQPQWTFYAGLLLALWTLGTALEAAGAWSRDGLSRSALRWALARWFGCGVWAALLAGALAAVQLLPTGEAAGFSTRSAGVDRSDLLAGGIRALTFLVGPSLTVDPPCLMWEDRGGFGVLWLAAAALAPLLCRGKVRYQAGVCAVLFVFAFGGSVLLQGLPGFRLFRQHARMLMVAAIPVAYLAGVATHALVTGDLNAELRRRCRDLFLRVLFGAGLLVGLFALRLALSRLPIRPHPYWFMLVVTVPGALWLVSRAGTLSRRQWAFAWCTVLLADLWGLAWPLVAVRPEAEVYARPHCVEYLAEHSAEHGRVLDRDAPPYRTGEEPVGGTGTPLGAGAPFAVLCGLEPLRGYNALDQLRYKEYLEFIAGQDAPLHPFDGPLTFPIISDFPVENRGLLDLLGVRYLVAPADRPLLRQESLARAGSGDLPELPAGEAALTRDGWRKVLEDDQPSAYDFVAGGVRELPRYAVYENTRVLPRAFIVPHAVPLPARTDVMAALRSADFRDTVFVEGYEPPAGRAPASTPFHPATVEEYTPNRVRVRVGGHAPGWLVLADAWYPGWVCTVDGAAVPVYRADYLFRAVPVPAGTHEVTFRFDPPSYRVGRRISLLALALVAAVGLLAFHGWARGRKRKASVTARS